MDVAVKMAEFDVDDIVVFELPIVFAVYIALFETEYKVMTVLLSVAIMFQEKE